MPTCYLELTLRSSRIDMRSMPRSASDGGTLACNIFVAAERGIGAAAGTTWIARQLQLAEAHIQRIEAEQTSDQ